jgi:hypothetical protein
MKRLLRSLIYRQLRNLRRSDSNAGLLQTDAGRQSTQQAIDNLPIEGLISRPGELKTVLQQMDPYDLEQFVAALWEWIGWETEVSAASNPPIAERFEAG